MTMIIPLVVSLVGVVVIGVIVVKVYRKYKGDVERARLKYSTEN